MSTSPSLRIADLQQRVDTILRRPDPQGWRNTSISRKFYLDLMETILRTAAGWQDTRGAIIDPVEKIEHGQTSCRFVAPGAILLSAGRIEDLRENVLLGMDWVCQRLPSGEAQSPDFWMREIMTAWNLLGDAPPARRARWEANIRSVNPEAHYWQVSADGSKLEQLHNWTIYAAAGEALRDLAGLGPPGNDVKIVWGTAFYEKYMPAQLKHFSDMGMYRDPDDPFTYDMTTRLQIATPLAAGFGIAGLTDQYDELLTAGALSQLLYVSPAGYAPFGGRSGQMQLQEAILSALAELEASRYRKTNPRLAAAFKRQAHVSAASIKRWIMDASPLRHIKNGFDPSTRHGCESYAKWSVYSLFAASCLGLAYLFADDSIEESPMPAEIGGYTFELHPAFHKVFACCGQTQLEIDTQADPHYDATGLGRFHQANVPLELGLSMPICANPNYTIPGNLLPQSNLAIGPGWQQADATWVDLAELTKDLSSKLTEQTTDTSTVQFMVEWHHAPSETRIVQRYALSTGRVTIAAEVQISCRPAQRVRLTMPLLETDGQTSTAVCDREGAIEVLYGQWAFNVAFDPNYNWELGPRVANRNGIYRVLQISCPGDRIGMTLSFQSRPSAAASG